MVLSQQKAVDSLEIPAQNLSHQLGRRRSWKSSMIAGLEHDLHTHLRVTNSTQKCLDWEHLESGSVVAFVLIST